MNGTYHSDKGMYHIHIDAIALPNQLRQQLIENMGFKDTSLNGSPPDFDHFETAIMLTRKTDRKEEFNQVCSELERLCKGGGMRGYFEGEYIASDEPILYKPHNALPVPFKIKRRQLQGAPNEEFRQTELHFVLDKDASDQRLIGSLLNAGLYGAYMPKRDHTALVLTMQGFRTDILPLMKRLRQYVEQAGGAYRASLKEEVAIRHGLFGITYKGLPEIAASIKYS